MPYVNKPRPYKKEYQQQKERNEHERRMKRQKNRRDLVVKRIESLKEGRIINPHKS